MHDTPPDVDQELWPGFGEKLRDLITINRIDKDLKLPDYVIVRYIIVHLITIQALIDAKNDHAR